MDRDQSAQLLTPPIALNPFRLWHRGSIPVAYASWTFLSEDAEARLRDGGRKLAPADWKSGPTLWLMDVLAPLGLRPRFANGGQEEVVKEIREKVFPGKRIKTLQPAPDGSGMAVVEW